MSNTYKPTVEDAKPLIVYTGKDVNDVHMIDADLLSEALSDDFTIADDKVHVDFSKTASGEVVTADGSYLRSLAVYGKAVQNGTPTPSAPVLIEVVSGINLMPNVKPSNAINATFSSDGSISADTNARTFAIPCKANSDYTYSIETTQPILIGLSQSLPTVGGSLTYVGNMNAFTEKTFNTDNNKYIIVAVSNESWFASMTSWKAQLEKGSDATAFIPYSALGLKIGSTITPIDLQGNVLASLPDGTKDELTVDSAGHVVMTKRVGVADLSSLTWITASTNTSGVYRWRNNSTSDISPKKPSANNVNANIICSKYPTSNASATYSKTTGIDIGSDGYIHVYDPSYTGTSDHDAFVAGLNGVYLYYELATPTTIDLGYIDPPAIPDGASISITAQVTPTIDVSVWSDGAEPIAKMVYDLENDLKPTYISKASFDNFCTELGTFLNATIIATYDDTDEEYNYVIEANE